MPGRILITTALGNVGAEVARASLARGLPVRLTDRDPAKLAARFPGAETARLDFLDRATWPAALAGCDRVFLLRPPPIGDMKTTLIPFVDAAYAAGVTHVAFLSVAGAERMAWVPHRKVELHLIARGLGYTLLRPGFFAQNLQDAYRRDLVEDDRLYVSAGAGRVAFLDVHDVGDVAACVLADPARFASQALTLTGPTAITFSEVAALLTARPGRTIRYEPASILGYARHLRRHRGLTWTQIAVQTILHVGLRRGDAEHVEPTVEDILGRPPRDLGAYLDDAGDRWRARSPA
jgi:uncharacterized protein YbjT (DUF2867 family)